MYRQQHPDDPGMHHMADTGARNTYYRQNPTFCERIKESLLAFLAGVVLIIAASCLLFWNEGRAVQTSQSLEEGLRSVISLPTIDVAFEENNHQLVHLTGSLKTSKVLYDEQYGVALNAVTLQRKVEMYQWIENESKREINEGSQTRVEVSYSYDTEWKSTLIQSSSFNNRMGHDNPSTMAVETAKYVADDVQVGNFYLSKGLVSKINNYKKLVITDAPNDKSIKVVNGGFYHGNNPLNPEVGDLRVTFQYAGLSGKDISARGAPDKVSIIARQLRSQLSAYQTGAGDEIEMLYMGEQSAQQIFGQEQAQNAMMTWGLRSAGWLLMFVAFGCLTQIVITLVDWLPVIRELVGLGITTLNLTLSISLSLTVIALGWIRYRPWLGLTLLACAALPFVLTKWRRFRRTSRDL